jgi:hypothetical protein
VLELDLARCSVGANVGDLHCPGVPVERPLGDQNAAEKGAVPRPRPIGQAEPGG